MEFHSRHELPDDVPINTVEILFEFNEFHVYWSLPFFGLFNDYLSLETSGNMVSIEELFPVLSGTLPYISVSLPIPLPGLLVTPFDLLLQDQVSLDSLVK